MRRLAKILIAGTLIATPMLPPLCGAATSQSLPDNLVINDQAQSGDVLASQTLNVVVATDQTTATTTATGNGYTAQTLTGSMDVRSSQALTGRVDASTTLNVVTDSGAVTALTTAATGNTGEVDNLGGGALTGNLVQRVGATSITSESQIEGPTAQSGQVSANSQAIANTQGIGMDNGGHADVTISQSSAGITQANGGGIMQYSPGTSSYAATAVTNNVTATGVNGTTQALNITQSMTGDRTQAANFVAMGNGQTVASAATATANNVSVNNDGGPLDVTTNQTNASYLRAQAETASYEFGTSTASAFGVGNSVSAGESGVSIGINNAQSNSGGGIDVLADSSGTTGYDLSASATAMGNAVTGYACTTCGGVMNVHNQQTNSAEVGARATVTAAGGVRSVNSVATAVGNNATFYVSQPGGGG